MRPRVASIVAVVDLAFMADDRKQVVFVKRLGPEASVPGEAKHGVSGYEAHPAAAHRRGPGAGKGKRRDARDEARGRGPAVLQ